jgi:hypothetical protein
VAYVPDLDELWYLSAAGCLAAAREDEELLRHDPDASVPEDRKGCGRE